MKAHRPHSAALADLLGGQEGQLEPDNSLIMATKLSHHRSSLAETYFTSKHRATAARPADNTEVAQLRKKAGQMGRDFQALLTAHERQEAAVADLRQKTRVLRQELEGRERALDLARRTVERVTAEKGSLEAAAAGTQAYVRKLEARLLSVRHAAELQQRCTQLKGQLDSMASALHESEARGAAAEQAAQSAALDAACLKRGLELAAEQLTKSSGAEVPGTLLKAVARGQEEALALSVQLSDAKQQVAQLTAALEQARAHLQAQQTALAQQQSERQELRQRAEAAEAGLEKQRAATSELRRVLDALRPKAGALAEERESLLHQLELERTAAAEAQKEAKQLRATLRQKAATEAALRDELRRALAGEGVTPSPQPKQHVRPASAAVAAGTARSNSRVESSRRALVTHQQQQAGGAQPSRRAGTGDMAGARSAQKAALQRGSAWQPPQHQPHHPGNSSAGSGGGKQGLIPAEPSPTRALLRLQEQRRAQQGSRLGGRAPGPTAAAPRAEQGRQERQQPTSGSLEAEAFEDWQLDAALVVEEYGSGRRYEEEDHHQQQQQQQQQAQQQGQWDQAEEQEPLQWQPDRRKLPPLLQLPQAQNPAVAAVLPVGDGRLMQLYTSALDEQIASLEGDLAQLEGAPSPIAHLKAAQQQRQEAAAAAAAAAEAGGKMGGAGAVGTAVANPAGKSLAASESQLQQSAQGQGAIGAWRPNSTFQQEPDPQGGGRGMQQLLSPGAEDQHPALPLWHSNPLAGSPPPKQQQQQQRPAEQEPAPRAEVCADGALTVRALLPSAEAGAQQQLQLGLAAVAAPSQPAAAAAAAGPVQQGESLQQTEDWLWGQLQQALTPVAAQPPPLQLQQLEAPCSAAASSPSLRLPGPAHKGGHGQEQQQVDSGDEVDSGASAGAASAAVHSCFGRQQQRQRQQQQQAASEGSCGKEGVASLSHHWELPSPGPGNSDMASDWLSHEFEADIEHLEVSSCKTPLRRQMAAVAAAAAARGGSGSPDAHGPKRPASSGSSWAGEWEDGGTPARESAPLLQQPAAAGASQRQQWQAQPVLPGLALVSGTPQAHQQQWAGPEEVPKVPTPECTGLEQAGPQLQQHQSARSPQQQQHPQQEQRRTLFDLADMDLHELLCDS